METNQADNPNKPVEAKENGHMRKDQENITKHFKQALQTQGKRSSGRPRNTGEGR